MSLFAFGKNTVENLIRSDFFEFKRVIIFEDKKNEYLGVIDNLLQRKIVCEILKKEEFDKHIPDKKHQGIVAFMKDYNYCSINYLVRKKPNGKFPLLVMLDSIEDPHNFGAIIRSCAALEVDGIIISNKSQVPVNSTVVKVSIGGISHVPVSMVNSLEETINTLKNNNYLIISTVCEEENMTDYQNFFSEEISSPICIIFGNEHGGIKKRIVKKSDHLVTINLKNQMNSLNVSVSCGIIISSVKR